MRIISILLLCLAASAAAQPRIGTIDFYGRQKVTEAQIRAALAVKEGDPLPKSKGDVEDRLEQIPNVVRAQLEAACCDGGKAILYVGIEEKGAHHFDYNEVPSGLLKLPQEVHDEYTQFLAAVGLAVRAGELGEDLRQGHSLMKNEGARKHQERFAVLAKEHLVAIRDVLKNSVDEEHRAIAAYVIGYAPNKAEVVNDLIRALRDPDDTVRNNAMRSLGAITVLAAREPDLNIKVSPTWFIEMLDSLIWSDRSTAAVTLVTLTERRDPATLEQLRERSDRTLAEMARWKHLPHALPAFILFGRIHGVAEEEIQKVWADGDRKAFVESRLVKPGKK